MARLTRSLVLLCGVAACTSEPPVTTAGELAGTVIDTAGVPIAGVDIELDGTAQLQTDTNGRFVVGATVGNDRWLRARRTGYVPVARRVEVLAATRTTVPIVLRAEATPISVAAIEAPVEVRGDRSAGLSAPAGAFVDATGAPATGPALVTLTAYDPSNALELAAYPGDLGRARTVGGEIVPLETWGVVDVIVRQNGRELRVAPGASVTLSVPAPSAAIAPPATADFWAYDYAQRLWLEEPGDATYDSTTGTYTASVTHLSPFNVDRPYAPTCIRGVVRDASGAPVAGAWIAASPVTGGSQSSDLTDADGYYCLYVERNEQLELRVFTSPDGRCTPDAFDLCETTRTFAGSALAVDVNEDPYPDACAHHCTWVSPSIEVGAADPGPDVEPTCDPAAVAGAFDSYCGRRLERFYECFAPEGECTSDIDLTNPLGPTYEVEFENGARMEMETNVSGQRVVYYGPHGTECGYTEIGESTDTTYHLAGGGEVSIRTEDDGTIVFVCDGVTSEVRPAELDAIQGCSGSAGEDGVTCKPAEGTLGAECRFDAECNEGLGCCGPIGDETCQVAALCDAVCTEDWECERPLICCSVDGSGYRFCLPLSACSG